MKLGKLSSAITFALKAFLHAEIVTPLLIRNFISPTNSSVFSALLSAKIITASALATISMEYWYQQCLLQNFLD